MCNMKWPTGLVLGAIALSMIVADHSAATPPRDARRAARRPAAAPAILVAHMPNNAEARKKADELGQRKKAAADAHRKKAEGDAKRKKAYEEAKRVREAKEKADAKRRAEERAKRDAEDKRRNALYTRVHGILPNHFWNLIDERQIERVEGIQRGYEGRVKAAKEEQARLAQRYAELDDQLVELRERLAKDKDSVLSAEQRKVITAKRAKDRENHRKARIAYAAARKKAEAAKKKKGK
jgi:colicin import membrane protein